MKNHEKNGRNLSLFSCQKFKSSIILGKKECLKSLEDKEKGNTLQYGCINKH